MQKTFLRGSAARAAIVAGMAGALALGSGVAVVFAMPSAAYATEAESSEQLCELVNPVLQSYVPAPGEQAWTLEAGSRMVIKASDENVSNERLAEVVKLVNSELKEKGLADQFLGMVYASTDSATANDIVVDIAPVADITSKSQSKEAYKIEISDRGGYASPEQVRTPFFTG